MSTPIVSSSTSNDQSESPTQYSDPQGTLSSVAFRSVHIFFHGDIELHIWHLINETLCPILLGFSNSGGTPPLDELHFEMLPIC